MYILVSHYKVNTPVQEIELCQPLRSPSMCPVLKPSPSLLPEVTSVLTLAVISSLFFLVALSPKCATLETIV